MVNWQINTKSWSISVGSRLTWDPSARPGTPLPQYVGRFSTQKAGYYQLRLFGKGTSHLIRTHEFHALTRNDAIKVAAETSWKAPMQLWHEGRMLHHWLTCPADWAAGC